MEEGSVAKVLQDFFTTAEGELCLQKGDIVQILKKVDKLWYFGSHNGKMGNMPSNYLIVTKHPDLQNGEKLFAAIANFPAQQNGDLSFEKGELIVGVYQVDENWWQGRVGNRVGMFPRTYTWQLDDSLLKKKDREHHMNSKALVKKDIQAQIDEEIDLHAGDVITVMEIIDKDWYRGESRGKIGIFPAAFVTLFSETESSSQQNPALSVSHLDDTAQKFSCNYLENDAPPTYSEVFGRNYLSSSAMNTVDSGTNDMLQDDYFKQNSPGSFFSEQNDNQRDLLDLDQSKDLGIAPYGISLYPFHAQFSNELSFDEGEIVTLIRYISKDWMEGKINDRKGIFPCNYVNIIVDCGRDNDLQISGVTSTSGSCSTISCDLETESFAAVLYNFDAQMSGDINVKEGEVLYIMEQPNENWCKVRNHSGEIGLCPRNYLTLHVNPQKTKNSLFQRFSLANDHILQGSETVCVDHKEERRSYHSRDFSSASHSVCSVDDLIALNIDDLKSNETLHAKSSNTRDLADIFGGSSIEFASETSDPAVADLDWQNNISEPTSGQNSSHSFLDDSVLPTEPSTFSFDGPLQSPQFDPPVPTAILKRQISDRVPHRPAPPVPLPGQKPMRRAEPQMSQSGVEVKTDSRKPEISSGPNVVSTNLLTHHHEEEKRLKNLEQRQNVITELVMTEKEYVRDLKITFEVFNLHDPSKLENRGVNVKMIFGNILDVMNFADDFLDKLLLSMKGKGEEEQCIGGVFLEMADKMKNVYGEYCMNHDNALNLLEKYETDQEIQRIFNKGLETLRYQIACFDMSSILIKPVQRILKYPLILNELIKFTSDSHKDKQGLLRAVKTIMDVATYINECKRRKDIVSKYLIDGNSTISSKMARISLHSVAKKSTRFGMLVSSTLGFGAITKDPAFIECEAAFHVVEKTIRTFLKDIESFIQHLHEVVLSQRDIAEGFAHFYQERHPDVEEFSRIQRLIYTQYFKEFESTVQRRVIDPLNTTLVLFEGPVILTQKQHDKFLDYNACFAKAEKNKDVKIIQEELLVARNNYQALNDQLLEELPTLVSVSSDLFIECLSAFVTARKLFTAKVMKHYLAVLEKSKHISSTLDVVESCSVRYNLVLNQLCRLHFLSAKKSVSNSPTPKLKQQSTEELSMVVKEQTSSQRAYLQSHYNPNKLYSVIRPCVASESLELSLNVGHLVAVIKKQNPMGDSRIWFVDDGGTQGFVNCSNLKEIYQNTLPPRNSVTVLPSHQFSTLPRRDGSKSMMNTRSIKKNSSPPSYRSIVQTSSYYSETTDTDNTPSSTNSTHTYEDIPDNIMSHYAEIPEGEKESMVEVYNAMYDFQGDNVRTLSVKVGQSVKILQKHDAENNSEWWFVEDSNGKQGFVPGNFLGKHAN